MQLIFSKGSKSCWKFGFCQIRPTKMPIYGKFQGKFGWPESGKSMTTTISSRLADIEIEWQQFYLLLVSFNNESNRVESGVWLLKLAITWFADARQSLMIFFYVRHHFSKYLLFRKSRASGRIELCIQVSESKLISQCEFIECFWVPFIFRSIMAKYLYRTRL